MKKVLLLILMLLVTIACLKSQDIKKYKLTATVSPLLFYKFDESTSSEHFNNYNYSYGFLGTFYLGKKTKNIRFSVNSGIVFKTKKYISHYFKHDNGILAVTKNDHKYIGIPLLMGVDFNVSNYVNVNLLLGLTLNKIVSTSYLNISGNGINEKMDPGLSYTGLNEFYSQFSFCKKSENRKFAVSLGPFISYKYLDDIAFSHNYFHLGRFSYGVALGFSFLN